MANNFNEYLRNAVLNHVFGDVLFDSPGTLYLGLSTTPIADNGTGETEPVGGGYARQALANNKTTWSSAAGANNFVTNAAEITFPESSGAWGNITHFFISDGVTGGNIFISGALTTPKDINAGDVARFPIDSIRIELDDIA